MHRRVDASENHYPKVSSKEELDHALNNISGLICEDKHHAGVNEHLLQCSQMLMINIEIMCCDRLFGSLCLHENKLRKINFKFEGKLETLNEPEIQLILLLRD